MAVALLNRNVNTRLSKIFMSDAEWLQNTNQENRQPCNILYSKFRI